MIGEIGWAAKNFLLAADLAHWKSDYALKRPLPGPFPQAGEDAERRHRLQSGETWQLDEHIHIS